MRKKSETLPPHLRGGRPSSQKRGGSTAAGEAASVTHTSRVPRRRRKAAAKESLSPQKTGLKGWKEIPIGGIILEAGNAAKYQTGSWRTFYPVRDEEKCTHCLRCWIFCPDSAVLVKDGKVVGFDYEHCKGCGICATECPIKVKAIKMVKE